MGCTDSPAAPAGAIGRAPAPTARSASGRRSAPAVPTGPPAPARRRPTPATTPRPPNRPPGAPARTTGPTHSRPAGSWLALPVRATAFERPFELIDLVRRELLVLEEVDQ